MSATRYPVSTFSTSTISSKTKPSPVTEGRMLEVVGSDCDDSGSVESVDGGFEIDAAEEMDFTWSKVDETVEEGTRKPGGVTGGGMVIGCFLRTDADVKSDTAALLFGELPAEFVDAVVLRMVTVAVTTADVSIAEPSFSCCFLTASAIRLNDLYVGSAGFMHTSNS